MKIKKFLNLNYSNYKKSNCHIFFPKNNQDIFKIIASYGHVVPKTITGVMKGGEEEPADANGHRDKVNVQFASKAHATLAFDSIPGPNRPDKTGRAQKRVYYKTGTSKIDRGGYLCIRKNS